MTHKIWLFIMGVWIFAAQASDSALTRDQAEQLRKEVSYGVGYHEYGGVAQRMNLDMALVRKGLFDAAGPKGALFNLTPAEIDQLSQQWVSQNRIPQGADLQAPSQNVTHWGVRQRLSYAVGANTVFTAAKNALLDPEYVIKGIFDAYGGETPEYIDDIPALKAAFNQWAGFLQVAQKQHEAQQQKQTEAALERSMGGKAAMDKRIQESVKGYDDPETQRMLEQFRD